MKLFTQETDVSQYLKEEALIVADYDYEKVTDFAVLGLKLRLKEGDDYEKITLNSSIWRCKIHEKLLLLAIILNAI